MRSKKHNILRSSIIVSLLIVFSPNAVYAGGEYKKIAPVILVNSPTTVTASSSPDNSHLVLTQAIDGATATVDLTAYIFRSDFLADSLIAALKRGVRVRMLLDGWPVAKPRAQKVDMQTLYIAHRLLQAGGKVAFIASDRGPRDDRAFRYVHAKYAVIDGKKIYVASENFGANSGHPVSRTIGNRGWSIVVENDELARSYDTVFETDWKSKDAVMYGQSPDYTFNGTDFSVDRKVYQGKYEPIAPETTEGLMRLERVMSPDDAGASNRAIVGAIKKARQSLVIQNLSFAARWGGPEDNRKTSPSPIAESVIEAARRGVRVRVMLQPPFGTPKERRDGEDGQEPLKQWAQAGTDLWKSFSAMTNLDKPERDNRSLIEFFTQMAKKEKLDLEASYFWVESTGIRALHNKGMVVDNKTVLVASINWVENSVLNNREAGVLVSHPQVAAYYKKLFERDWLNNRKK